MEQILNIMDKYREIFSRKNQYNKFKELNKLLNLFQSGYVIVLSGNFNRMEMQAVTQRSLTIRKYMETNVQLA